ncbi:MAG: dihydropteroate synthase [Gammaproteobacteria bacterium]|nr:dihydropteroate synthase [Gammaproteobacteria bacterium]
MNWARLHDTTAPPLIMGVLNVTPDSFSDGGQYADVSRAVMHAEIMAAEGADIIDIGAESSRPGAAAVAASEQLRRLTPVIEALRSSRSVHCAISVDTRSPEVAEQILKAGATLVNDISGARDPRMLEVVAAQGAGIVLMHMQGTPQTMQIQPSYSDVVAEVVNYLAERAACAVQGGVQRARILLDPGIGFGKTKAHNLALLAALPRLVAVGYPVLLGTSRKRFMGSICRETVFADLVGATCATTALGMGAGVRIFRVHDVKANRQALEVAWAIGHALEP